MNRRAAVIAMAHIIYLVIILLAATELYLAIFSAEETSTAYLIATALAVAILIVLLRILHVEKEIGRLNKKEKMTLLQKLLGKNRTSS